VPLYVLAKDPASNSLVVGVEEELGSSELTVGEVNWIAGEPPTRQFHALVKTRYTAREAPAVIEVLEENRAAVRFDDPQRDITPGQVAVFYEEDLLLGGGRILQPAHSQSMI
jgi:tRNA-specific 2-thiouridylase